MIMIIGFMLSLRTIPTSTRLSKVASGTGWINVGMSWAMKPWLPMRMIMLWDIIMTCSKCALLGTLTLERKLKNKVERFCVWDPTMVLTWQPRRVLGKQLRRSEHIDHEMAISFQLVSHGHSSKNLNQKTEEQRQSLHEKRDLSRRVLKNIVKLAEIQVQELEGTISGEQPWTAKTWSEPTWPKLTRMAGGRFRVDGCRFGMKSPENGASKWLGIF